MRWYTEAETGTLVGPAFLEIKLRSGTRRAKLRAPIDLDPAWLEPGYLLLLLVGMVIGAALGALIVALL